MRVGACFETTFCILQREQQQGVEYEVHVHQVCGWQERRSWVHLAVQAHEVTIRKTGNPDEQPNKMWMQWLSTQARSLRLAA